MATKTKAATKQVVRKPAAAPARVQVKVKDMLIEAISENPSRTGCSFANIKKYLAARYKQVRGHLEFFFRQNLTNFF